MDSDLGHVTKSQELILKFNSQTVAENTTDKTSCNSLTRASNNKLVGATTNCNLVMSKSSDVEQNQGASDISTDASAEAQISDSEQATYASANNDLKGTKAYQEADVSGLHNLAMAIVDYRGYRVVAQVQFKIFSSAIFSLYCSIRCFLGCFISHFLFCSSFLQNSVFSMNSIFF